MDMLLMSEVEDNVAALAVLDMVIEDMSITRVVKKKSRLGGGRSGSLADLEKIGDFYTAFVGDMQFLPKTGFRRTVVGKTPQPYDQDDPLV